MLNWIKPIRFQFFAGLLLLLAQSSCSTQSEISNYSGDGRIVALPYHGFWRGGGGYIVQFKPIQLDQPTNQVYHFTGLPKIAWRVNVFFAIKDSRSWEDRRQYEFDQQPSQVEWAKKHHIVPACYDNLNGALSMSLKDEKGDLIFQYDHKLSDLVWSRRGSGPWELYPRDFTTSFPADSQARYTLEVKIDPDPILKEDESYVLLRSGGRESVSIGF